MQSRSRSHLAQSLNSLISEIRITSHDHCGGIDIYPSFRSLFTDKAAQKLHNRVNDYLNQRNEVRGHMGLAQLLEKLSLKSAKSAIDTGKVGYTRVIDIVCYFGSAANNEEEALLAIEKIASTINQLADKDYITGSRVPLSIIELAKTDAFSTRYVVISYVALTNAGQYYAEQNLPKVMFKESGIPLNVKEQE